MQHAHGRLFLVGVLAGTSLMALTIGGSSGPAFAGKAAAPEMDDRVELGRRLFFDPSVSRTGRVSCGSCHDPAHGFSDPRVQSVDDDGDKTRRHSSTLIDCQPSPALHWDGEFATVKSLVFARIGSSQEFTRESQKPRPDLPGKKLNRRLRSKYQRQARSPANTVPVAEGVEILGRYEHAMNATFGSKAITTERIAQAIDAYVDTIRSTEAPVDRYMEGDVRAISESARRGHGLFHGRAGCAQCHLSEGDHPKFSDYQFHDTGVSFRRPPTDKKSKRLLKATLGRSHAVRQLARFVMGGRFLAIDGGRVEVSGEHTDLSKFKTPSLRDVALRPPYMHDGSFATLDDVVAYYAGGGTRSAPNLDPKIKGFRASGTDIKDLVAFLHTLTGDTRPGRAPGAWKQRALKMRVGFVDRLGRPLVDLPVVVSGAGDALPGADPRGKLIELTTDARGEVSFRPPLHTHARLALPGDIRLPGGNVLPDTCRHVRVAVPVGGWARLRLRLPEHVQAPDALSVRCAGQPVTALRQPAGTGEDGVTYGLWLAGAARGTIVSLCCETELGLEGKRTIALTGSRPVTLDLR